MRAALPLVTVLLLFPSLESCINPFAPRLDFTPASSACNDLTNIENVLCTFRNAYTFKDTTLYSSIIGNDFVFTYRDYDQGVDVSWGRTDEMHVTYAMFQSVQDLQLTWNNEVSSSGNDTVHSTIRGFTLTVTFSSSDIAEVDGYASLTFARHTTRDPWRLVLWNDQSNY